MDTEEAMESKKKHNCRDKYLSINLESKFSFNVSSLRLINVIDTQSKKFLILPLNTSFCAWGSLYIHLAIYTYICKRMYYIAKKYTKFL